MKFYALLSKRQCGQPFHERLVVLDEIWVPEKPGQVCVEIAIEQPDASFDVYEIPITDQYDRIFELPVELLNEGTVRVVTTEELKAWEAETNDRVPLP